MQNLNFFMIDWTFAYHNLLFNLGQMFGSCLLSIIWLRVLQRDVEPDDPIS